ncbi:hypothetical protein IGI04_028092 [Brassica rapa subsp. trilocularis]|uniref:RNase H type-1 domain-containing protein n=1 Tax=Brassica rapa subsp. trilocularis TaxID=1813537 RepID=A0ABQ7L0Y2_BRACM|nr:hypothetical protein IGI04_028092 [Brassica rapa subsp. trilocularis]
MGVFSTYTRILESEHKIDRLKVDLYESRGLRITQKLKLPGSFSSALMVETLAISKALIHTSSLNFTNIYLRTDSQVLVREITMDGRPSELFGVLTNV